MAEIIKAISLWYFNPVSTHVPGLIGELQLGFPCNFMSFVTQAVIGKQKQVTVYGNDYDRTDGSCVKDHIHVVDLAEAHVKSCSRMIANKSEAAHEVFNVWTGVGYTVLEVINACEKENQIKLNYTIGKRREGDAQVIFADVTKANSILQWKTEKHLKDMVIDSWRWEKGLNK